MKSINIPLDSFNLLYIPLKSLIFRRTLLLYFTSAIVIIVAITIFYLNFAKKIDAAWFDDSWIFYKFDRLRV